MAELHVMDALREKQSELSGAVSRLEQQLAQHRGSLAHLDATMRLFDPDGSVKNLGRYAASWIAGWPNRPSSTAALT